MKQWNKILFGDSAKYYFLTILISFLPLLSIFLTKDLFHSHDGLVHLPRLGAYFKALNDGQIPVRWVGDLNYGYGMPLYNYIYHLPYFIASIFLYLGFGLANAFKISISLSYVFSGIFMFAFARAFFRDNRKAFLVTMFYQFSPFRFVELLIRGSFGEVYTYTFLPLVLLGITMLINKLNYRNFFLTAIAAALLILSHNALSLVFFSICCLFIFFFSQKRSDYFYSFLALLCGLLISSFYWVPAVFEHKYTYGDLFMKNIYLDHFPPIQNFFIPNIFNSTSLQIGGISVQIGLFHVLALITSLFLVFKSKIKDSQIKRITFFSFFVFFTAMFFMQPTSGIFWERISLLKQFQFPWRFLGVVSFASSILAVNFFIFKFLKNDLTYCLFIFLVVVSTAYYWKPALGYDKINENYYWNFPLNTTYYGETDVIWSAGPAKSYPKKQVELIGGEAEIKNIYKKSNLHQYEIITKTKAQVVDHTQYFPGWKVFANGREIEPEFQDQNWRGEITFRVPEGKNLIRVQFGETKMRFITDLLSLSTLIILVFLFLFRKKLDFKI